MITPADGPDGEAAVKADNGPSFKVAVLSFLLPILGVILYYLNHKDAPRMARSAGRGTVWGLGAYLLWGLTLPAINRAPENGARARCRSNLIQLGLAAMHYCQDYDGKYPDLSLPESLQAALEPYVKDVSFFSCPKSGRAFVGNARLSWRNFEEIKGGEAVVLFYEFDAVHLESRNVGYVDGHVKSLRETPWLEAKKRSGIQ